MRRQTRNAHESGIATPSRAAGPRKPGPVRLTRRGRVVVFTFLLGVAGAIAGLASAPGQAADPPGPAPTIIVQPGDTLWEIAGAHQGSRGRDATVEDIRRLNNLDGYGITAGQRLVLPRTR